VGLVIIEVGYGTMRPMLREYLPTNTAFVSEAIFYLKKNSLQSVSYKSNLNPVTTAVGPEGLGEIARWVTYTEY